MQRDRFLDEFLRRIDERIEAARTALEDDATKFEAVCRLRGGIVELRFVRLMAEEMQRGLSSGGVDDDGVG